MPSWEVVTAEVLTKLVNSPFRVHRRFTDKARSAEFAEGSVHGCFGVWMVYKKSPSNFFSFWGYIEHVYVCLYILKKGDQYCHWFENYAKARSSWYPGEPMEELIKGGLDGSFNFLYTLNIYRKCKYLLICVLNNCHQHFYGFENFMSSCKVGI